MPALAAKVVSKETRASSLCGYSLSLFKALFANTEEFKYTDAFTRTRKAEWDGVRHRCVVCTSCNRLLISLPRPGIMTSSALAVTAVVGTARSAASDSENAASGKSATVKPTHSVLLTMRCAALGVGIVVGDGVGTWVEDRVGISVGSWLGVADGVEVGVRVAEGNAEGSCVGVLVGAGVGVLVGIVVGVVVGVGVIRLQRCPF